MGVDSPVPFPNELDVGKDVDQVPIKVHQLHLVQSHTVEAPIWVLVKHSRIYPVAVCYSTLMQ